MMTLAELKNRFSYDPDTGNFIRLISTGAGVRSRVGDIPGSLQTNGYIQIWIDGKNYLAHRLAWFYVYGYWPKMLDHRNRIKTDNRIENLREATPQMNQRNRNAKGVHWCKKIQKHVASIKVDGKSYNLGSFHDEGEALQVRKLAEIKYGFLN